MSPTEAYARSVTGAGPRLGGRLWACGLALGAVLTLAACVPESAHPLSDPATSAVDPALAGSWRAEQNGQIMFAHFVKRRDKPTEVVVVNPGDETSSGYSVLTVVPSRIGGRSYMSLKFFVDDGKVMTDTDAGWQLLRYQFSDDGALVVWAMSDEAVSDDIRQGLVAGDAEGGRWTYSARLTADTERLAAYVAAADPERVFGKHFATFRRVK